MAEQQPEVAKLSIPQKFMPLYLDNRDAPIWDDGSQHWMEFDTDANPIDEDGNPIAQDALDNYGYKRKKFTIMYGGRGGGKSESMALISIIKIAMQKPFIILCCRELMASIRDSMYQTIIEWIETLGLTSHFDAVEHEIRCKLTGSKFIFKGLRSNIQEIRSMKGVGLCIIDEAANISKDSVKHLIPTLRLDDAEFWLAFNTGTKEDFIYNRFVINADDRCCVIKVNLTDNGLAPKTLIEEMEASRKLAERTGDWDEYNNVWLGEPMVARDGGIFKPENIKIVPSAPPCVRYCRGWDFASSAVSEKNPDPDYTAAGLIGVTQDGQYCIKDIIHFRDTPDIVERALMNTAALDGLSVEQSLPIDPGQAGKAQILNMTRKLSGYRVHSSPESGPKTTRAEPFASQVNCGNVLMVSASWNELVINQMKQFNGDPKRKDDVVDCLSRSFSRLQAPYAMQMVDIRGL